MSFAERLREARCEKKYSQELLAEKIGVSRQTITKWESGTGFPEVKKTFILTSELMVSLDWLFEEELSDCGRRSFADNNSRKTLAEGEQTQSQKENEEVLRKTYSKLYGPLVSDEKQVGVRRIEINNGGLSRGKTYYILGAKEIGKIIDATESMEMITDTVAKLYNIDSASLISKKRTSEIAKARQVAIYICKEKGRNINEISQFFNCDHMVVMHACGKIEEEIQSNVNLKNEIMEIIDRV